MILYLFVFSIPNVYISYRILLAIHETVSTTERSCSELKLLKSYMRSTMLQDRLNVLAILSIRSEILKLFDFKTQINDFEFNNVDDQYKS